MSDRKLEINTKAIHPRALKALGLDACIVMLGIARDLRDGEIKGFSMKAYFSACGTPCCIAGHLLCSVAFCEAGCGPIWWIGLVCLLSVGLVETCGDKQKGRGSRVSGSAA